MHDSLATKINSVKGKQFEEHWQKQKITDFGQVSVMLGIITQPVA